MNLTKQSIKLSKTKRELYKIASKKRLKVVYEKVVVKVMLWCFN